MPLEVPQTDSQFGYCSSSQAVRDTDGAGLDENPWAAGGRSRVRIDAIMKVETTPGGAVKTTYTARAVHRLNGEPT